MQGTCTWSLGVCGPGAEQREPSSGLGLEASRGTAQHLWPPKHVSRGVAISLVFCISHYVGWRVGRDPLGSSTAFDDSLTYPPFLPCPLVSTKSSPWTGLTPPSPSSLAPVAHLSPNSNLSTSLSPAQAFTPQLRPKFCLSSEPTVPKVTPASNQASCPTFVSESTL